MLPSIPLQDANKLPPHPSSVYDDVFLVRETMQQTAWNILYIRSNSYAALFGPGPGSSSPVPSNNGSNDANSDLMPFRPSESRSLRRVDVIFLSFPSIFCTISSQEFVQVVVGGLEKPVLYIKEPLRPLAIFHKLPPISFSGSPGKVLGEGCWCCGLEWWVVGGDCAF